MLALFALWLLQPAALAVGEIDILLIRVDHVEQLALIPPGLFTTRLDLSISIAYSPSVTVRISGSPSVIRIEFS